MPWWKNLFIIAYLIVQVALPLRGCLYDRFDNAGEFSWNMYTYLYTCEYGYRLDTPGGETRWPRDEDYFNRPTRAQFLHADSLPEFHRWLCDKFRRQGEMGTLRGYRNCFINDGPEVSLVDSSVDLCTARNYGVRVQLEAPKK